MESRLRSGTIHDYLLRILLMGAMRFGLLTLLAVISTAAIACGSQEVETGRAGVVQEILAKQGLLAVR